MKESGEIGVREDLAREVPRTDVDIERIEKLKRLNILANGNKTRHKVQINETSDEESSEFRVKSNGSSPPSAIHTNLIFLVLYVKLN